MFVLLEQVLEAVELGIAEREVFRAPREPAFDLACGVGFSANVLVLFLPDACVLSPQRGKVS